MTEPSSSNHGGQQGGKKKHGQSSKGSGSGGGGGSSKLRGLPKDSEDVRISKTLSWVLRHGAQKESLYMRKDGYVRVKDLLGSPRFATVDFEKLEQLVKTDKKNRYDLRYEPDLLSGSVASIWWIRANQGHSMKNVTDLELTPVHAVEDIPTGIVVHGTTRQAWEQIQKEGLSKMTRIHIHFAQGLLGPGIISGMRDSAKVLIYINVQKALDAGLKFFIAKNGAVLSPGDDNGFIKPEFFDKVVSRDGTPMPGFIPSCTSSSSTIPGDVSTSAKLPVVSDPDTQTVAPTPASGPAKS
ncbi:KptA family-domain-containing protein [Abortiporus biennis]|nr:KptA family-domain-containing protein [Abortiporus biennis]